MKGNDNKVKKPSAFKGVDTLFEDAAPKAAPETKVPGEKKEDELALVALAAMHPFPDHPYTVDEADNDMAELVDSVQREGLLERIVVQRRAEGGFEILSGHRRHRACQILGINEVPVLIKNGLTKDQAILLMVDANLKRKNILPMDEAKALKMQMDAMNRMGKRSTHGKVKRTDEVIAEKINKNRMYVQRKVKLLELTPELQEAVNDKTLSETPAFEIAYLPKEVQELFHDWMIYEDRAPTVAQAISLRQHQQELTKNGKGKAAERLLTEEQIERIMDGERLAEIFPPPEPEKTKTVEKAVELPAPAAAGGDKTDVPTPQVVDAAGPVAVDNEPPVADAKAIPFQTPNTKAPEPGRTGYNSSAPTPAPATSAQPAADAAKAYIRTEYMAELRKDNVILPKSDLKGLVPNCDSNIEYVIAIKKVLTEAQAVKQGEKAVEDKTAPQKPPLGTKTVVPPVVSAPKPVEPPKAEKSGVAPATKAPASPTAEKPAVAAVPNASAVAKVDKPTMTPESPKMEKPPVAPTNKMPKPPKPDKPPVSPLDKAPEAPKVETPPATPAAKTDKAPPATASKSHEPTKAEKPTIPTPAKAEPAKPESSTKALDDFLKNKPRPGKGKPLPSRTPDKAK